MANTHKDPKTGRLKSLVPYNQEKHVHSLLCFGKKGEPVVSFCLEHGISRDTFMNWAKDHPELKEAYERYKLLCRDYWFKYAKDNLNEPSFNTKLYGVVCKAVGCDPEVVQVRGFSGCKTAKEKLDLLDDAINKGLLPSKDIKLLNSSIDLHLKIDEHTVLAKELAEIKEMLKNRQ